MLQAHLKTVGIIYWEISFYQQLAVAVLLKSRKFIVDKKYT